MAVVKRAQAERMTDGAIVLDLADLRRQSEQIIADAQADAAAIRADAETRSTALVDSADARGFEQGHARGMEEGRAEGMTAGRAEAVEAHTQRIAEVLDGFDQALRRWDADREAMLLAAREDVLEFALTLARKIVVRIPTIDPTVVSDQVREALAEMLNPTSVTIDVNPADFDIVNEMIPTLHERFAASSHARIEVDASITQGGCRVRTEHGSIDATLETQLDRVARALLPGAGDLGDRPRAEVDGDGTDRTIEATTDAESATRDGADTVVAGNDPSAAEPARSEPPADVPPEATDEPDPPTPP